MTNRITKTRLAAAASASSLALAAAGTVTAQDSVEVLTSWTYDSLYDEGWSVENMFGLTDVVGPSGEEIGDVENLIFSNDGEVLGIIAEVGGFWDIADTHVLVPWEEVTLMSGIDRVQIPVTEDTVEDYDVFGDGWFDEEIVTADDADMRQTVDDDLVAGSGVFKATDLIGDYTYLEDNTRYGYVADAIVQDGKLSAMVVDAGAYGRRGYYAYPYAYRGDMTTPRYGLPYESTAIDDIENFDYEQLQSRIPNSE